MKIILISDTHGYHNNVKLPEGDILIHCGDYTNYGELWEVRNFLVWFGNQKPKHKIFINGNHEVMIAKQGSYIKQMVEDHNRYNFTNIHYLEGERLGLAGLNFYGNPRTPEFFDWAYMYRRENGKRIWQGVPENTDVLITHGPPAGILDKVQPFGIYDRDKAGCDDLMDMVKEVKPKLHCFGHIHTGYGWRKLANPAIPTLFVNAATCDGRYIPVNPPIVVDTETWKVL